MQIIPPLFPLFELAIAMRERFRMTILLAIIACLISALSPANALPVTAWVTGANGVINNTINGGTTSWNSQASGVIVELTRADAVDNLNAWAVGDRGTIVHTGNGGTTWNTQTNIAPALTSSDILRGLDFIDVNSGWTVGRRNGSSIIGVIAHTTDGGSSWSSQTIGTDESLVDVDFIPSSTTGWLVGGEITGSDSIIRKTVDGNNWSAPVVLPISIASGILNGVDFVDLLNGWAVGAGGKIIKTTDGGVTWIAQTSGTTAELGSVMFLDSQRGWATGIIGGEILRTLDGGANWTSANVGSQTVLRDIAFVDANNGWAVGSDISNFPNSVNSVLLYSSDGGSTWSPQSTSPGNVRLLSGLAIVAGVPEPASAILAIAMGGMILLQRHGRY